jgi:hypothetical protein
MWPWPKTLKTWNELLADPLYVAAAGLLRTNQGRHWEGAADDPLLEGPK